MGGPGSGERSGATGDESVFAATSAARRRFADLVEGLDEGQLQAPSLCRGWTVRTVAGHLAAATSPSPRAFLAALARSGGRMHRANDAVARRAAAQPVDVLVQSLRQDAGTRSRPPIVGPRGPLADVLVHTADVAVPLGLPHDAPAGAVLAALQLVTTGRPVGFVPRGRLSGLALAADDLGWAWGSGAAVSGQGIDVLVATCGRREVLDRLRGPGVALLASRLGTGG